MALPRYDGETPELDDDTAEDCHLVNGVWVPESLMELHESGGTCGEGEGGVQSQFDAALP